MFLPWVNQLVESLHNDAISGIVITFVQRVANDYPKAVTSPYRTSFGKLADISNQALKHKEKN